jgi:dihydrofolate synthase/folylpolyglutamate synthase
VEDLLGAARALDVPACAARSAAEGLTVARELTPAGGLGGLIVATGSVYLVGAVREAALTP